MRTAWPEPQPSEVTSNALAPSFLGAAGPPGTPSMRTAWPEPKPDERMAEPALLQAAQDSANQIGRPGVGCIRGCMRDRHLCIGILSSGLLAILILLILCMLEADMCQDDVFLRWIGGELFWVVFSLVVFMYLLEPFSSATYSYLINIKTTENTLEYMDRLYLGAPHVEWHIQCYHYETTYRTVTERDSNGNETQRTESREVKVHTHSASGSLSYQSWTDTSVPLDRSEIIQYQMTKLELSKDFTSDAGYETQKNSFIRFNDRDTHHDFSEILSIPGFSSYVLTLQDITKKPWLAHWGWFLFSHAMVIFSLPYRLWLSSVTGKVETAVTKHIVT